jgi:hypothetical protein
LKCWWQKTLQDQKDKLVSVLTIPDKPHNTEWIDLEAWRDQLSAKEVEETQHHFRASSRWGLGLDKWALKDVNEIAKWDNRIAVMEQSPLFKDVSRDTSWSITARRFMDFNDENRISNSYHLRV